MSIATAAKRLGIGRTKLTERIHNGELSTIRNGRVYRIPATEITRILNSASQATHSCLEPLIDAPTHDPEATTGPTLILDTIHQFRGIWEEGSICRVRIFEHVDRPPVVVFSELADNTGTSMSNIIECLAPEVIQRYLPQRMHSTPPAVFLGHFDAILNARRMRSGQSVIAVRFSHYRFTIVNLGGFDRLSYGEPSSEFVEAPVLTIMIGDCVDLDNCSTNTKHQIRPQAPDDRPSQRR